MAVRRKREWFDDDSLWRELYDFMFPESRFEAAARETAKFLRLVRPRGRAVLDLCCGPGRFSVALAKRGYRVTGVDRTRFYLNKARARARAARVKIEWVHQDMRDFVRPGAFDLAISMYTSFGYFENKVEDLRVLRHVYESLKPGGAFLVDVGGKEWLARIFLPATIQTLPDGRHLVQRHEIYDGWTRIRNEWILVDGARAKTWRFHHTIYSGQELRDLMERTGFEDVRIFGSLDGEEYGTRSLRLVVVGRKGRG